MLYVIYILVPFYNACMILSLSKTCFLDGNIYYVLLRCVFYSIASSHKDC